MTTTATMTRPSPPRGGTWRNWAGTVNCRPSTMVHARDEQHIADVLGTADGEGRRVRCVGTGHSFNQLACTDATMLDVTSFRGVEAIDQDAGTVTVRGGTTIGELSAVLHAHGLAMDNIGTLANQTIAGALATGNHGTGFEFGPLSSQVTALRLIRADGERRDVSRAADVELFRFAVVSLGALGVVSAVTLRCVPQFAVRVRHRRESLTCFLDNFEATVREARHVSVSWLPWRNEVDIRTMDVTYQQPSRLSRRQPWITTLDEMRCGTMAMAASVWPAAVPALARVPMPIRHGSDYLVPSQHGFCFPQPVRFVALEHALPLQDTTSALRLLGGLLRAAGGYSPYSVLIRVGAEDDAALSPAYGRRTGYLNVTVPRSARFASIHRSIEPALRALGGRPHWGKAHTATAADLRPLYPEFGAFLRCRQALDPRGTFTNGHLDRVLGS